MTSRCAEGDTTRKLVSSHFSYRVAFSIADNGTRYVVCPSFDIQLKARRFRINRPGDDGTSGWGADRGHETAAFDESCYLVD